ncbi:MAG: 4Fe-4S ferredoxin [Trueperaceae bacterium]|nr:4Fe-4S ferredoxin [Trueperaceae bacterium]
MIELPTAGDAGAQRPSHVRGASVGFDLLRIPGLRALVRWRYARLLFQIPLLVLALFVVADGLTGRQLAPRNVATTSVWLHYRGFVVLALAFVGNAFCASCPLMLTRGPTRWLKRVTGVERPWPRVLRSKWLVIVLLVAFLLSYEIFSLWSSPWLTAWLVIGYFGAALATDTLFPAGTFCRYVCPLGNFNFVLAHTSPSVIAALDHDVCARCETKPCLHGRVTDDASTRAQWEAAGLPVEGSRRASFVPLDEVVHPNGRGAFPGCETGLFVPTVTSTMDCTMCFNCVRACPYDNVALRVRAPWREAVRDAWGRRSWTAVTFMGILLLWWGLLNALAMIGPFFEVAAALSALLGSRSEALVLVALFALVSAVGLALTTLTFWLGDRLGGARAGPLRAVRRWGSVAVILAVGIWTAHYLFHFLTGALQIIPVFAHFFEYRGFAVDTNWRFGALVPSSWLFFIGAGIASLYGFAAAAAAAAIALRDFGARGVWAMWPVGLFAVAITVVTVLVMGQPMEMRGTLLGPAS